MKTRNLQNRAIYSKEEERDFLVRLIKK